MRGNSSCNYQKASIWFLFFKILLLFLNFNFLIKNLGQNFNSKYYEMSTLKNKH